MFVNNFELRVAISCNSNRLVHHKLTVCGCHLVAIDGHFNVSSMKYTLDKS